MAYTALLDKQLSLLFKRLKDLVITATFTKTSDASFDFTSGEVNTTESEPILVEVIEIDGKKTKKESSTVTKTLIAKAASVGDLNSYDVLKFNNATWKIGTIIKASGLILIFEVVMQNG
jgi:uncharacterized ParB-like nuclease family protein